MTPSELRKKLTELQSQVEQLLPFLRIEQKKQSLLELQDAMQQPGFWDDAQEAGRQSQKAAELEKFISFWDGFNDRITETQGIVDSNTDESEETMDFLDKEVAKLEKEFHQNRIVALLSGPYDDHNAVVAIHAGAGGTDAQDWAEMLLRMYSRFADAQGFKLDTLELSRGSEAGIKSVLLQVRGPFAFGYLKAEAGVHRLVRQSPFNPAHTRETSFALVEVLPELEAKEHVQIDPKDLKIEANTASGHGGQSVNTTYSAIRITHIPTGIRVSIQNERSQHQNREVAMNILMARLRALEEEKLVAEKKELRGEFKSAEWGNQIRSYVLHPYQMVKDHRTDYETSDTEGVLNGELDEFIERYLERNV